MSVSDPLLKELKGSVLKLTQENIDITDENLTLQPLCQTLEKIFQKGLSLHYRSSFLTELPESWSWLVEVTKQMESGCVPRCFNYVKAVEFISKCPKLTTNLGRLRLLIRMCLVDKCLHIPVEIFVRNMKPCHKEYYNNKLSILGDDILGEIFLSAVLLCSKLNFKLNINNSRFLDVSWLLPDFVSLQFVPCDRLGISISFVQNKAVVIAVEENSVAGEDDKVEVGDVLDELNNTILTSSTKGRLCKIMLQSRNKPITVKLIKAHYFKCGDIYSPLIHLLRKTNIDPEVLKRRFVNQEQRLHPDIVQFRAGYKVTYLGGQDVGADGNVKRIEPVICSKVADSGTGTTVYVECQELGVKVTNAAIDYKEILNKSYMEISACGQVAAHPNYFAFIAGDVTCNEAETFTCHVFHCDDGEIIQAILHSIGQGFHRTHFVV